jgi:hypothetical protein
MAGRQLTTVSVDAGQRGSGKKYKKCHLKSDEIKRVEARYSAQVTARNRAAAGMVPGRGAKARRPEKAVEPPQG